jgi:hypothetical protein
LIAFNLDRFQKVVGRKSKFKIINSIVDQLEYAGCRFVKMVDMQDGHGKGSEGINNKCFKYWMVMNQKDARIKVAHALRDKRKSQDHVAALARLKERLVVEGITSGISADSRYIAANAMMLTVEFSGDEPETLIKARLCDAIDSVGAQPLYDETSNLLLHSPKKERDTNLNK